MDIRKPDHNGVTVVEVHNAMELVQVALSIGFATVIGQWVNEGKLSEEDAQQGSDRAIDIASELTQRAELPN